MFNGESYLPTVLYTIKVHWEGYKSSPTTLYIQKSMSKLGLLGGIKSKDLHEARRVLKGLNVLKECSFNGLK